MKNKITYIVDDDRLSVKLVSLLIAKNAFSGSVIPFHNPRLALQELIKNCNSNELLPDCILLDLNMPVMDGWQFLEEYKTLGLVKNISIFIISSSNDPADIKMGEKYPMVKAYILKPLNAAKLKTALQLIE